MVGKTILVIDDESEICDVIGDYFEDKGHEVVKATSGERGLSLIKERRPDIIFLDLKLKDISGIEVLTKLRHESIFSRVVMVSGVDDMEKISLARDLGIEEYLIKPFDLEELDRYVNEG